MNRARVFPKFLRGWESNKNINVENRMSVADLENLNKDVHYPCLCEAVKQVMFWSRLVGILPIIADQPGKHTNSCTFRVSQCYQFYSYTFQIFYAMYILTTYITRFTCGPEYFKSGLEWYVMTFGYFITDCDSLVSLMAGSLQAKKTCKLLEKLSHLPGPIGELRKLEKTMQRSIFCIMVAYLMVFTSYIYVGWLRFDYDFGEPYYCTMLDQPFGVVFRGFVVIVPTIEIGLIIMVSMLVCTKFKDLAETTRLTLENCQVIPQASPATLSALDNLPETHENIFSSLKDVNKCVGLQLLMAVCSSLYTMIYYLYRYSTSSEEGMTSNTHERIHYIIGLSYRIGKLVIYMILGQNIVYSSLLPLHTLQRAKIINLPTKLQQQVQTLMLQWHGKKGSLSALNVINLGPWLLAPIIGNVATYLLVVLQFRTSHNSLPFNITAKLESIF